MLSYNQCLLTVEAINVLWKEILFLISIGILQPSVLLLSSFYGEDGLVIQRKPAAGRIFWFSSRQVFLRPSFYKQSLLSNKLKNKQMKGIWVVYSLSYI